MIKSRRTPLSYKWALAAWLMLLCITIPACSQLGYFTSAPVADVELPLPSAALSPAPVQAQLTASRAVIVLLDDSLSMDIAGYDRDGYRYELAEHILSKLMPRDSVAVAIFGGQCAAIPGGSDLRNLVQKNNRREYEQLLTSLRSKPHLSDRNTRNKTNFKAALAPALELLSQPRFQSSERHIFLLTDGEMDIAGDNTYDEADRDDSSTELECLRHAGKLASGQPDPQHREHTIAIHAFGFSPGLTQTARAFLERLDYENSSRFSAGVRELKVQVDIALARLVDVVPVEPTGKQAGEFRFAVDPTITELVLQLERLAADQPIQLTKAGRQQPGGTIDHPPGDEWTWTYNADDLTETISYRATRAMPDEYKGTWLLRGCRQARCQGIINQESNPEIAHAPEFTVHPLLEMYALPHDYFLQAADTQSQPLELGFLSPLASGRGVIFGVRLAELRGDAFQAPAMDRLRSLFLADPSQGADIEVRLLSETGAESTLSLLQSRQTKSEHVFSTSEPWHGEPGTYLLSTRVAFGHYERVSASAKIEVMPYELTVSQPQAPLLLNASTHLSQAEFAQQNWLMRQIDMGLSTLLIFKPQAEPEFTLAAEIENPVIDDWQEQSGVPEVEKLYVYQRIAGQPHLLGEIPAAASSSANGNSVRRFESLVRAQHRPPGSSGQIIIIPEPYVVDTQIIPLRFTGITAARSVVVLLFLLIFILVIWLIVRSLMELVRPRFRNLKVSLNGREATIGYLKYTLDIVAPGAKRSRRGIGYRRMTCFNFTGDQLVRIVKRRNGYLVALHGLELKPTTDIIPDKRARRVTSSQQATTYVFNTDMIELNAPGLILKIYDRGRGLAFN